MTELNHNNGDRLQEARDLLARTEGLPGYAIMGLAWRDLLAWAVGEIERQRGDLLVAQDEASFR